MGQLERVNGRLAAFRDSRAGGEARSSIDQWISEYLLPAGMVNQFTYNGHVFGMGGPNKETEAEFSCHAPRLAFAPATWGGRRF